jgi:hypothetical protein
MVVYTYNPRTWEVEAERSGVWGQAMAKQWIPDQSRLPTETLLQTKQNKTEVVSSAFQQWGTHNYQMITNRGH